MLAHPCQYFPKRKSFHFLSILGRLPPAVSLFPDSSFPSADSYASVLIAFNGILFNGICFFLAGFKGDAVVVVITSLLGPLALSGIMLSSSDVSLSSLVAPSTLHQPCIKNKHTKLNACKIVREHINLYLLTHLMSVDLVVNVLLMSLILESKPPHQYLFHPPWKLPLKSMQRYL